MSLTELHDGSALGLGVVERVGNPWHGMLKHRRHTTPVVSVSNPSGHKILSGDPVTGPDGTGVAVAYQGASTSAFKLVTTAGAFAVGDAIQAGPVACTITAIDAAPSFTAPEVCEAYVVTDQGAVEHTLRWEYDACGHGTAWPWIVAEYQRTGQPAASTSSAEAALGWEWRNTLLAPSEYDPKFIMPFTDAGNQTWLIGQVGVSLNHADYSGRAEVYLYPILGGVIDVLQPLPSASLVVSHDYAAGGFPAGIDTNSENSVIRLLDIKAQGRTWLLAVVGINTQYVYGLLELTISGTGSLSGGGVLSGLSVDLAVVRSTAACDWQTVSDTTTPVHTLSHNQAALDAIADTLSCGGAVDVTVTESYTCDWSSEETRIIGGWYDGSGALVEVSLVRSITGHVGWAGTYVVTVAKSTAEAGCQTTFQGSQYNGSSSGTETTQYRLRAGAHETGYVEVVAQSARSHTGAVDNSGSATRSESLVIQGTTVSSTSSSNTWGAGLAPEDSSAILACGADLTLVAPSPMDAVLIGDTAANSVRLGYIGPIQESAQVYGMAWAYGPLGTPVYFANPTSAGYTGFLSKAGATSGLAAESLDGTLGRIERGHAPTYTNYSLVIYIHPRHTAYNPHTGAVAVGQTFPAWPI